MKKLPVLLLAVLIANIFYAQELFFKSTQAFTTDQLQKFYSSIAIHGDLIVFSANDYNLYAYNPKDGSLKWSTPSTYKSNTPVYSADTKLYAGVYIDKTESTAMFDAATGKMEKLLPVGPLVTMPVLKNGVLYGTALNDGGRIFAYDVKNDTILWSRFLAHGFSTQPYFFDNKIQANAESDNWVSLDYSGRFIDTTCKVKAEIYVSEIPCVNNFYGLTHDRKEINAKLVKKIFGHEAEDIPLPVLTNHQTFILYDGKLVILGDKLKVKNSLEIASLSDTVLIDNYETCSILKANDDEVAMLYGNHLVIYNQKNKKADRIVDLSAWEPHRALLHEDRL
jgi:hypothetical protein